MEFGFAALHQLCEPVLDKLDAISAPQRKALHVTFGIEAGPVPDRFLVGLAVLSLLGGGGGGTATHMSDRRRAVAGPGLGAGISAFVARRLGTESVGLVFGARTPSAELTGLPELGVGGLADDDAQ